MDTARRVCRGLALCSYDFFFFLYPRSSCEMKPSFRWPCSCFSILTVPTHLRIVVFVCRYAAVVLLCRPIAGKQVGVLTGTEGDATPFTDVTVANVSSTLHKIGFQKHGNEVMYSGHTGRMLNTKVRGVAWRRVAS